MTTDYRAELQRLVKAYDDHGGKWPEGDVEALFQAVERARTALNQPEPPSRLRHCPTHGQQPENAWGCPECVREMRQQLAQPEPEGPTEEEIDDLFWKHSSEIGPSLGVGLAHEDAPALIREALACWGRPAVEPVPVSERLPGPEDCDAEGRCWWWDDDDDKWCLYEHSPRILCWTYWLPHYALSVPTATKETL